MDVCYLRLNFALPLQALGGEGGLELLTFPIIIRTLSGVSKVSFCLVFDDWYLGFGGGEKVLENWWSWGDSNPLPLQCH